MDQTVLDQRSLSRNQPEVLPKREGLCCQHIERHPQHVQAQLRSRPLNHHIAQPHVGTRQSLQQHHQNEKCTTGIPNAFGIPSRAVQCQGSCPSTAPSPSALRPARQPLPPPLLARRSQQGSLGRHAGCSADLPAPNTRAGSETPSIRIDLARPFGRQKGRRSAADHDRRVDHRGPRLPHLIAYPLHQRRSRRRLQATVQHSPLPRLNCQAAAIDKEKAWGRT